MTNRSREDYLAASGDFDPYDHRPGSVVCAQPAEVDNWCQSIAYPDSGYPLTPPDTASDCAPSDCADMNGPWNQVSPLEESRATDQALEHSSKLEQPWATDQALDHSTYPQHSGSEWQPSQLTARDLHDLDPSHWLNISRGSVDVGLSPVLSHESQNTHALNSVSEPELPPLPPGLDLCFTGESAWGQAGSVVYSGSIVCPQDLSSSLVSSPEAFQAVYPGSVASLPPTCEPPRQPPRYFQGAPAPSYPVLAQPSFILPRAAEGVSVSNIEYHVQPTAAHAQMAGAGRAEAAHRVSSAHGQPIEMTCTDGPTNPAGPQPRIYPAGHDLLIPRPDSAPCQAVARPVGPETTTADFAGPVHCDQEDAFAASPVSYAPRHGPAQRMKLAPPGPYEMKPMEALRGPMPCQSSSAACMTSESDEGRHRNDPLYSRGPGPDGLYHCPFKKDSPCGHNPTKLKCNYDKFIDSHLKPFRCKVEACSKQEFSSTACLLRHEREAHGMYGHGKRPHLCEYPGCERGIPGNGFPRLYNCGDHMRRVHDHKGAPSQERGSPERKSSGRKRKPTGSVREKPAAQRAKVQQVPTSVPEPSPVFAASQATVFPVDTQRAAYSPWADHSQLLESGANFDNGPQDELSLRRLSPNVPDFLAFPTKPGKAEQ